MRLNDYQQKLNVWIASRLYEQLKALGIMQV